MFNGTKYMWKNTFRYAKRSLSIKDVVVLYEQYKKTINEPLDNPETSNSVLAPHKTIIRNLVITLGLCLFFIIILTIGVFWFSRKGKTILTIGFFLSMVMFVIYFIRVFFDFINYLDGENKNGSTKK